MGGHRRDLDIDTIRRTSFTISPRQSTPRQQLWADAARFQSSRRTTSAPRITSESHLPDESTQAVHPIIPPPRAGIRLNSISCGQAGPRPIPREARHAGRGATRMPLALVRGRGAGRARGPPHQTSWLITAWSRRVGWGTRWRGTAPARLPPATRGQQPLWLLQPQSPSRSPEAALPGRGDLQISSQQNTFGTQGWTGGAGNGCVPGATAL